MFNVEQDNPVLGYNTSSSLQARSQIYGLGIIDIYSNSWGPTTPFTEIDKIELQAINRSTIQVFEENCLLNINDYLNSRVL